jgi:hypothetical protein
MSGLFLSLILLGGGAWILGPKGFFLSENPQQSSLTASPSGDKALSSKILLKANSPFYVAKSFDAFGLTVSLLRYRLSPQQFVIFSGLGKEQMDELLGDSLTRESLQGLAGSALKVLRPDIKEDLIVEKISLSPVHPMAVEGASAVPKPAIVCKSGTVTFRLGKKASPKTYEGLLGKMDSPSLENTLVLTFANQTQFSAQLLPHLLEDVVQDKPG